MKKLLLLAMVMGLLASPLTTFSGEFKPIPFTFEGGNSCVIPLDWKLINVNVVGNTFYLWFQNKEGDVYMAQISQGKVQEIVHKISSNPIRVP